ncbi:MAG: hypothetical protein ACK47B_16390 [Armatimonadota bacterium]
MPESSRGNGEASGLARRGPGQQSLLTYAVLTGLTPLIPIPFVDDLAKAYFRRRLVRKLAAGHGVPLSREEVEALTAEPGGCLLSGCLGQLVLYPLKKIFRKIFYFLEWKRALDLTSQSYHFGYLVDCALADGYLGPSSPHRVEAVRQAIHTVCAQTPIKPIEGAVGGAFRQSKSAIRNTLSLLERTLRRLTGRPQPAEVSAALNEVEAQESEAVRGVVENLQRRMQTIPQAHFDRMRQLLRQHLA